MWGSPRLANPCVGGGRGAIMPACYWAVIPLNIPPSIFHIKKGKRRKINEAVRLCDQDHSNRCTWKTDMASCSFSQCYSSVLFLLSTSPESFQRKTCNYSTKIPQVPTVPMVQVCDPWKKQKRNWGKITASNYDSFHLFSFSNRCSACQLGTDTLMYWSGRVSGMQIHIHLNMRCSSSNHGVHPNPPCTQPIC